MNVISREVRKLRNAETILNIMRQRGQQKLPVQSVYRLLYQRNLYLQAYGKLYRNEGAMTPGVTSETVDSMSLEKIDALINLLRYERYCWTPVRRTYVVKKSGKQRPYIYVQSSRNLLQRSNAYLEATDHQYSIL